MTTTIAQRVYDYLETSPDHTDREISVAIGLPLARTRVVIDTMIQQGKIPAREPRRYRLVEGAERPMDKRGGPRVPKSKREFPNISVSRRTE